MYKRLFTLLSFIICAFIFSFSAYAIDVSAKGAVLIECDSNDIVYSKNANMRLPMASTTKIMTALVAIENCDDLEKIIKIPRCATGIEGSSIYLHEDEELTISDLLYALMLESANDSAVALAYATCGDLDKFVDLMNEKASELGLENTHFTNPHGLDNDEHYTTAYELGIIASYAMNNPVFSEIVSTYKRTIPLNNGEGTRVLVNHNRLLRSYQGAIGIKTGFTKKCGRCLVSCAEVDGARFVCVTLNAPNDWNDHKEMLDYGFSKYESVRLADVGDYVLSLDLINGVKSNVLCSNFEPLRITLEKENINISARVEYDRLLFAPINQNDVVGRIVFYNNDKEIGSLKLYALETVKNINYKKSLFERLFG